MNYELLFIRIPMKSYEIIINRIIHSAFTILNTC